MIANEGRSESKGHGMILIPKITYRPDHRPDSGVSPDRAELAMSRSNVVESGSIPADSGPARTEASDSRFPALFIGLEPDSRTGWNRGINRDFETQPPTGRKITSKIHSPLSSKARFFSCSREIKRSNDGLGREGE